MKRKSNSVFLRAQYLGLGFFNIYVNGLPQKPSCGRMEMFADDTTLYCFGDSIDDVGFKIQISITE